MGEAGVSPSSSIQDKSVGDTEILHSCYRQRLLGSLTSTGAITIRAELNVIVRIRRNPLGGAPVRPTNSPSGVVCYVQPCVDLFVSGS